jgi:hypothetical protein
MNYGVTTKVVLASLAYKGECGSFFGKVEK